MPSYVPKGDQQLAVSTSPVSLTVPTGARRCYIEIHTNSIYYTYDGVTPASGNGGRADPGDVIRVMGDGIDDQVDLLAKMRFIRQSADALAIIHYFA